MLAFNFNAASLSLPSRIPYAYTPISTYTTRIDRRTWRAAADPPLSANKKPAKKPVTSEPAPTDLRATPARALFELSRVVVLSGIVLGLIFLVDVLFGLIALSLAVVYAVAVLFGARDAERWPRRLLRSLSLRIRGIRRRWKRRK